MPDEIEPTKRIRITGRRTRVTRTPPPQMWNPEHKPGAKHRALLGAAAEVLGRTEDRTYVDPNDPPMLEAIPHRAETLQTLAAADIPTSQEPWLRFKDEPTRQWRAFVAYRDLGERRSYNKAAEIADEPLPNISFWSQKWQWPWRIECFDRYVARLAANAVATEHAEMLKRHVGIANLLQEKALMRLRSLEPGELSARELLWYLKEAVAIERVARALPAETIIEQQDQHEEAAQSEEWMSDVFSILVEAGALPEGASIDAADNIIDAESHEVSE